nr:hypothetical protein CFP56_14793 [Quercus suber]
MVGSSGLGFWGGNPLADPKVSGSVGGHLPLTIRLVGSGGDSLVSSRSGEFSGLPGFVDTPWFSFIIEGCVLRFNPMNLKRSFVVPSEKS